jgi:hypothetical protein
MRPRHFGLRTLALLAGAAVFAGGAAAQTPPEPGCHYDIVLRDKTAARLGVTMICAGDGPFRLATFRRLTDDHVRNLAAHGGSALDDAAKWQARGSAGALRLTYDFDVEEMIAATNSPTVGLRAGRSVLSSVRSFLLLPEAGAAPLPLSIRFSVPEGAVALTGLASERGRLRLNSGDLRYIGFMVMGEASRLRLPVKTRQGAAAELEVAILDGPRALDDAAIGQWLADSAARVSDYFGGFPTGRGLLVLRPVAGRNGLLRGMVNAGGGATMLLLLGAESSRAELRSQWMLMHELVHFGAPFIERHPWIMEGMAVYVETVLRVRAGWFGEDMAWRGFMRSFPLGLAALQEYGLAQARGIGPVYWGGTLFWLLADVEIIEKSGGKKSIADCFAAVLDRGGDTSQRWPLERFIAVCDAALGDAVLRRLADRHVEQGAPVDLAGLWQRLGVKPAEPPAAIAYDESAPLAWVRRRIMQPAPGK